MYGALSDFLIMGFYHGLRSSHSEHFSFRKHGRKPVAPCAGRSFLSVDFFEMLIRHSMTQALSENPVFLPLAENPRFQAMVNRLRANEEKK